MAATDFSRQTDERKTFWANDLWMQGRNLSYINKFLGKDENSVIQHVTELTKSERGARAVITLVNDTEGDGVVGDRTLQGNEEALRSSDIVIEIDQMRNAHVNEGRMSEQASVVRFRQQARNKLAYWISDRMDQLAFLNLSGVSYRMTNQGAIRPSQEFNNLVFSPTALDAPSPKRFARWNATTQNLEMGVGTSAVTAADLPMWEMFVQLKAIAKENYIRAVREKAGEESYHAFLSPTAMAKLKRDPMYIANLRHAREREKDNPLFTGATIKIDGIYLHEFRHVYNTRSALPGAKWGAAGAVDGCQVLFCGAQALGMADLGLPTWVEEEFDYDNRQGISIAKMLGFKKPKFYTQYSGGTVEDFGVFSLYVAQ